MNSTRPPQVQGSAKSARPRWWPALLLLVLAAAGLAWIQFLGDAHQQERNLRSYLLGGVFYGGVLLWLVVLSRLRAVFRLSALAVLVLIPLVLWTAFRIKGVNGNLVPIFEWRWAPAPTLFLAESTEPGALPSSPHDNSPEGWPQFLGPNRNGTATGVRLNPNWDVVPPRERWRLPVGPAWSGFAVAQGCAVTMEQEGSREAISCFDALTGDRRWSHAYEARYATTLAGEGPRSTPCIDGNFVYATGATGWLTCLDLQSGRVIWTRNVLTDSGGDIPNWGLSVSPLVTGDQVIQGVDGRYSLVALDKTTGEPLWTGGVDTLRYSSPVLHVMGDLTQVLTFNTASIAGHDVLTGKVLWQHPYASDHVHVAAPLVVSPDRILVSSGYGHGSELFSLHHDDQGQWSAAPVWSSRRMKAKFTNLVHKDGFVYGLDDGILACISAANGELQWKDGRYGHGQTILADDLILVSGETGQVILVKADPTDLHELARMNVFSSKMWNPPALAGPYLFLRTDAEAVCLELALAE